jgi:uncharacterized protein (TIGR00661 family)
MMFSYKNDKVDYWNTAKAAAKFYLNEMPLNIDYIDQLDLHYNPSLYISDFEPSIPRAAKKFGKRLLSIDNQHRFAYVDMLRLPLALRVYGWFCGLFAKILVPYPDHTIISTFHWDKIKVRQQNVTLTNGLLRKDIEAIKPTKGGYVLVYLRNSVADKVLDAIKNLPHRFIIYAPMPHPTVSRLLSEQMRGERQNLEFFPTSPLFVKHLSECDCVISTAGNQLLTEARFWRKPVLAIPEPGQYEQDINANYAQYIHMGRNHHVNSITSEVVDNFIKVSSQCCYLRYERHIVNGVHKVTEIIRRYL